MLLVLGLLAACRESGPDARTGPTRKVPPAAAAHAEPTSGDRTFTINARDFTFDAPEQVEAGLLTVILDNRGDEPHHAWLVRLQDESAIDVFFEAVRAEGPLPPAVVSVGGPGTAEPGFSSTASIRLEPGKFLIVCLMASPDGASHMRKGMVRHLQVVPQ